MTLVVTQLTQPVRQPGTPLQRSHPLWIAGGVFVLLLVLTTMCGSLFNTAAPPTTNQPLILPGQTETAAQQVLATVQAVNARGTQCLTGPTVSAEYVAIWEMFGTPTSTPTRTVTPTR